MAKGAEFSCPNCGKRNFITFAQIKKHLKGKIPVDVSCGCALSPYEILDKLAAQLKGVIGKRKPMP